MENTPVAPPVQTETPTPQAPKETGNQIQHMAKNPEPVSEAPKTYDVKVNGRTLKMTEAELINHASMSHAAQDKFNEASQIRKNVDKILATAKTNPIEALMDPSLGLSKDQIRDAIEKWYYSEYVETEQLSEPEKKLRDAEKRLKVFEEQESQRKQKQEHEELERLTTHQRTVLQQQIISTIDKYDLPKTPEIVKKLAFYMRQARLNGWNDAPMEMIVQQVQGETSKEWGSIAKSASIPQLIKILGEETISKLRKHDLDQLRASRTAKTQEFKAGTGVEKKGAPSGPISSRDVNENLRKLRRGEW